MTIRRSPAFTAPPLDTERLTLRAHRIEDYEDMLAMLSDRVVIQHVMKRPPGPGEIWERLHRYVGHWALLGYGMWALRDRATGRWVGEAGVFDMKRGLGPAFDSAPEAGWMLAAHAHGRGLATEAVRCILAWVDQHLGPRTVCMIDEDNAASARVAAKLGYRELERVRYQDEPVVLYERAAVPQRVG